MLFSVFPKADFKQAHTSLCLRDRCEDLDALCFLHSKQVIHLKVTQSVGIQSYSQCCLHHVGEWESYDNEMNQWHLVHITTAEGLEINRDSERSSGQVSENTAGDNMKYTNRDYKKYLET